MEILFQSSYIIYTYQVYTVVIIPEVGFCALSASPSAECDLLKCPCLEGNTTCVLQYLLCLCAKRSLPHLHLEKYSYFPECSDNGVCAETRVIACIALRRGVSTESSVCRVWFVLQHGSGGTIWIDTD